MWISVKDRLPERSDVYFARIAGTDVPIISEYYYNFFENNKPCWWDCDMEIDITDAVCFWMEIPEQPVVGGSVARTILTIGGLMHDVRCESLLLIPVAIVGLLVTAVLLPVIIIISLVEAWR